MELVVSGLRKKYGGSEGEPAFILDLPILRVKVGQIVFILGHNGSGKSITLKLLAGEILPSENEVRFTQGEESWTAHKRPGAIVRQRAEDSLALDLTVRENLLLRAGRTSLWDYLFPAANLNKFVQDVVNPHKELLRKLDQPCRNLSGGQRQALAFLSVTSTKFPLLLLDEFLAATDSNTSRLLLRLMKDYARLVPATVFVVSHDVPLALSEADRILILSGGQLIRDLQRDSSDWDEAVLITLLAKEYLG